MLECKMQQLHFTKKPIHITAIPLKQKAGVPQPTSELAV